MLGSVTFDVSFFDLFNTRNIVFINCCWNACVTPRFPVRPEWQIRTGFKARDYILGLFTYFFFLKAELVPVGIQTISVITKIIYIHKRTTTRVVSIKIYTYILSPIYLYKYLYMYISNTNIRDHSNSAGEHLSLRWPILLVWNVLPFLSPLQYLHGLNTRAKLYA